MNVVLLTTGRPMRADQIAEARHQLRADPAAHLAVVSWNLPAELLPVDQHVRVRTVGGSHSLPVRDADPKVETAELEDDGSTGLALGPGGPEEEAATEFDDDRPEPVASATTLSKLTPSGVAAAVRWRANRARLAVRRHPTVSRVAGSTKLRRLRKALAPDSLGSRYAAACLVSREVSDLFDSADVVVAMDAHTHRAAWLLARRHPGPDVVVGLAAAQRCLQARKEQKADALS